MFCNIFRDWVVADFIYDGKVMVRNVDNEANIRWTVELGDDSRSAHNAGYSIIQVTSSHCRKLRTSRVGCQGPDGVLYVGFGWWQHGGLLHNGMAPAVAALTLADITSPLLFMGLCFGLATLMLISELVTTMCIRKQ